VGSDCIDLRLAARFAPSEAGKIEAARFAASEPEAGQMQPLDHWHGSRPLDSQPANPGEWGFRGSPDGDTGIVRGRLTSSRPAGRGHGPRSRDRPVEYPLASPGPATRPVHRQWLSGRPELLRADSSPVPTQVGLSAAGATGPKEESPLLSCTEPEPASLSGGKCEWQRH
jgi:hypothetical protein